MQVRQETPGDVAGVRRVHTEAFAREGPDGPIAPEVALTDELRETTAYIPSLSLVAVDGSQVVGHVITTRATLGPDLAPVLGLGPLGVLPARHNQGIGSALVRATIEIVDAMGEPLIILLGNPGYYQRFGFELAAALGIEPPDPAWVHDFQALRCASYRPDLRGRFTYAEPFDRV